MSAPKAEWKRAADFAEIAEALGIVTTDVLACWGVADNGIGVLFTANYANGDDWVLENTLRPDGDGILVAGPDVETQFRVGDLFRGHHA